MIDRKLLERLFQTGGAEDFRQLVQKELAEHKILYQVDERQNIFSLVYPDRPILCAHMDTVQTEQDRANASTIQVTHKAVEGLSVLGADDKCGVYIILHLLQQGKKFNFIFTASEEIRFQDSITQFLEENDIRKFPFALVLDSPYNRDIQCSCRNFGSKEFENDIFRIGKDLGFHPLLEREDEANTASDADMIQKYINCANISVGYYYYHKAKEYALLADIQRSEQFVERILYQTSRISRKRPGKKISEVCFDDGTSASIFEE